MDNMNSEQMQPQEQKGAGMSIASMVLGIVSLAISCCIPYVPFVCALIGLVLGAVALSKHTAGKGMAIAGIVCSIVSLLPAVYIAFVGASLISALSSL